MSEISVELDLEMQLSEHFKLWEFVTSQVASRKEIDNTPSQEVVDHLRTLCQEILEPAYQALGRLRISSGYRSPELNSAMGGNPNSAHSEGYAADVMALEASNLEFARWVKNNCNFDQIILEFGPSEDLESVYVSYDPHGGRKEVLRTAPSYISAEL